MKNYIILLILILIKIEVFCQNAFVAEGIIQLEEINERLNQNSILAIHEDSFGQIWVGTQIGVNIIFGKTCKKLSELPLDVDDFEIIEPVLNIESYNNEIYLITSSRIIRLIYFEGIYQVKKYNIENISSIIYLEKDKLLLTGSNKSYVLNLVSAEKTVVKELIGNCISSIKINSEVFSFYQDSILIYNVANKSVKSNPSNISIEKVFLSPKSSIYIYSKSGIYEFIPDNHSFKLLVSLKQFEVSNLNVSGLIETDKNDSKNLLIGTAHHGLFHFDKKLTKIRRLKSKIASRDKLPGLIKSLFLDSESNIWIGTNGGGLFLHSTFFPSFNKFVININEEIPENYSNDIWVIRSFDHAGTTYLLVSVDGAGLAVINIEKIWTYEAILKPDFWIKHSDSSDFNANVIHSIEFLGKNMLLGTLNGIYKIDIPESMKSLIFDESDLLILNKQNKNTTIVIDDSLAYFATYSGLYKYYENENEKVSDVNFTGGKKTKFGTYFHTENSIFKLMDQKLELIKDFEKYNVKSLFQSNGRYLWICTSGHGVIQIDLESQLKEYDILDLDIRNNTVYGILGDNNNGFWCSTNSGLKFFYSQRYWNFSNTIFDNIQREYNSGSYFEKDGIKFFGGVSGITWFQDNTNKNNLIDRERVLIEILPHAKCRHGVYYYRFEDATKLLEVRDTLIFECNEIHTRISENSYIKNSNLQMNWRGREYALNNEEERQLEISFPPFFSQNLLRLGNSKKQNIVIKISKSYSTSLFIFAFLVLLVALGLRLFFSLRMKKKVYDDLVFTINKAQSIPEINKILRQSKRAFWTLNSVNIAGIDHGKIVSFNKEKKIEYKHRKGRFRSIIKSFDTSRINRLSNLINNRIEQIESNFVKLKLVPGIIDDSRNILTPMKFLKIVVLKVMKELQITQGVIVLRDNNKQKINLWDSENIYLPNGYSSINEIFSKNIYPEVVDACDKNWTLVKSRNIIMLPIGSIDNKIAIVVLYSGSDSMLTKQEEVFLREIAKNLHIDVNRLKTNYLNNDLDKHIRFHSNYREEIANRIFECCRQYFLTDKISVWGKTKERGDKQLYEIVDIKESRLPKVKWKPSWIGLELGSDYEVVLTSGDKIKKSNRVYSFCTLNGYKCYLVIKISLGKTHEFFVNIFSENEFIEKLPASDEVFIKELIENIKYLIAQQKIYIAMDNLLGKNPSLGKDLDSLDNLLKVITSNAYDAMNANYVSFFPNKKPYIKVDDEISSSGIATSSKLGNEIATFPNAILENGDHFISDKQSYEKLLNDFNSKHSIPTSIPTSTTSFWEKNNYASMVGLRLGEQEPYKGVMVFNFYQTQEFKERGHYYSFAKIADMAFANFEFLAKLQKSISTLEEEQKLLLNRVVQISDQHMIGITLHDINNLMLVIKGGFIRLNEALQLNIPNSAFAVKIVNDYEKKVRVCQKRIFELTDILRTRSDKIVNRKINIYSAISNITRIFSLIYDGIVFDVEKGNTDLFQTDRVRLQLVIYNLIANSVHAIANVRKKKIIVRCQQDEENLYIRIEDNGVGIAKDKISTIFDMGYSDKNSSGIGLSYTRLILTSINGDIQVERNANPTIFTIRLKITK